ncbi:MAG: amidohydrolase/deacetylase family metallohydrolase [Gemmatimonadota bacterium]|nr:MAG: amidohydrolase/deacetylase family metallohydrolase [Gemmatimonadota bacterium]
MAHHDLLIRTGHCLDVANGLDGPADLAIREGRISAVGALGSDTADRVLDARGLQISAGWIDLHVHCYLGGTVISSIDADRDCGVQTGVTTVCDTGSFGANDHARFREETRRATTRVLGYLNVSASLGQPIHGDWSLFDQPKTIETLTANRDHLVGVKVLASQRHCGNLGLTPVKLGVQAAREAQLPLMAHIGAAPPVIQDVLELLEPGDVVTHCFKEYPRGIMNGRGRPVPEAWAAAERGVRFDIGHGQDSFNYTAARQAFAAGFPLHSISTDLHTGCLNGPVYSLGRTMAKFLHLGLGLPEVVDLVTRGPAVTANRYPELGSIRVGSCADLTLFKLEDGPVALTDSQGNTEQGEVDVVPVATVRAGKLVWSDVELSG